MKLAARNLEERARWLVSVRWIACLLVLLAVLLSSSYFRVVHSGPLLAVGGVMVLYNTIFLLAARLRGKRHRSESGARVEILLQVTLDLISLTLLLYFSDLVHNPFVACYFFHIVIASILLPGWTPYVLAFLASILVGGVLFLQHHGVIPVHPLALESLEAGGLRSEGIYLVGIFIAFAGSLGLTAYFASSVSRYVERVQARMQQQEKMLGIGQLVAGFAHQINNPLDGLQNCLRRMEQKAGEESGLSDMVRLMRDGLDRMARVARRLQEFARPHGMEVREMDVATALEAAAAMVDGACQERRVLLERDLAPVPHACGDPYSVQEVLFNLCTNAIEAMPGGGRLTLRLRLLPRVDLGWCGCVAVEVVDTGMGIAADKLEMIFEPFYTTRAREGGTGLGLGLCRMLLSEMGGRIEVESFPGKGATFRVLLPAVSSGEAEA